MRYLWLVVLLACGCTTARVHVEQGITSRDLTVYAVGKEKIEALITSVQLEQEFQIVGPIHGIVGAGPSIVTPMDGRADALTLDVVGHIVYTKFPLQPYLMFGSGLFYAAETWEPQGSNWGFITQVGFGVRYELAEGQWFNVDYRQWHESNGTKVFNHSRGPNPGFESGSIWLGYAVDF